MANHEANKWTKAQVGIREKLQARIDYYKENPPEPFMLEQVGKPDARERFKAMSPQERAEVISQVGIDAVMELLRKNSR